MVDLSTSDRGLIAALKQDSRASVTTLAAQLNLSRATVQSRLERLITSGVIHRFTIDVDASVDEQLIRAIMMIELQGAQKRSVIRAIKNMPEVASLHTTNGSWDLVAMIEVLTLPDFDRVLNRIREVEGVLNSETNILLNKASG